MNREEAMIMIIDLYINKKITEYIRILIQYDPKGEYFKQTKKNIELFNDLKKYIKENLK